MSLSRQDILNSIDIDYTTVDVPKWGGPVRLKALSIAEQISYSKYTTESKDTDQKHIYKLLVMSIVDDNGNPLFTMDDIEALAKKSSESVLKVFFAANDLNNPKEGELEDTAKKS